MRPRAVIEIASLGIDLSLAEIYAGVEHGSWRNGPLMIPQCSSQLGP